jgi:hypothetical protein
MAGPTWRDPGRCRRHPAAPSPQRLERDVGEDRGDAVTAAPHHPALAAGRRSRGRDHPRHAYGDDLRLDATAAREDMVGIITPIDPR